jgi:hypothetical protein
MDAFTMPEYNNIQCEIAFQYLKHNFRRHITFPWNYILLVLSVDVRATDDYSRRTQHPVVI